MIPTRSTRTDSRACANGTERVHARFWGLLALFRKVASGRHSLPAFDFGGPLCARRKDRATDDERVCCEAFREVVCEYGVCDHAGTGRKCVREFEEVGDHDGAGERNDERLGAIDIGELVHE